MREDKRRMEGRRKRGRYEKERCGEGEREETGGRQGRWEARRGRERLRRESMERWWGGERGGRARIRGNGRGAYAVLPVRCCG